MKKVVFGLTAMLLVNSVGITSEAASKPKLNYSKISLYGGSSKQLKVKNTKKKVKFSTSNKKVAKVSSKGKVTAVKKGTCKVYAKVSGKTLTCKVTVKAKKKATTEAKTTEKKTTEKRTTEKRTTEKRTTEKRTTEKRTTEKKTTEKATTEKPTDTEKTTEVPVHVHSYSEKKVDATECGCYGKIVYTCSCGDTYSVVDKDNVLQHAFVYIKTVTHTCTTIGYDHYKCSRCGLGEKRNIVDAKGHHYIEKEGVYSNNCTSYEVTFECENCGDTYKESSSGSVARHDFVEVSRVEPTCCDGVIHKKCSRCGTTADEVIKSKVSTHTGMVLFVLDREWSQTKVNSLLAAGVPQSVINNRVSITENDFIGKATSISSYYLYCKNCNEVLSEGGCITMSTSNSTPSGNINFMQYKNIFLGYLD